MKHNSKIIKWTIRILTGIIILFFLLIAGLYVWVNIRLDSVISDDDYKKVVTEIKHSKDLPIRFHELYKQVYNVGSTNDKYFNDIVNSIFRKKSDYRHIDCPCMHACYNFTNSGLDNITLALAFDRDVDQEKCIDYYLGKFDFLYSNIGIESASKYYFKKEISDLTDDEMIALIVMLENPSYYNILKNPKKIKVEITKYKK